MFGGILIMYDLFAVPLQAFKSRGRYLVVTVQVLSLETSQGTSHKVSKSFLKSALALLN